MVLRRGTVVAVGIAFLIASAACRGDREADRGSVNEAAVSTPAPTSTYDASRSSPSTRQVAEATHVASPTLYPPPPFPPPSTPDPAAPLSVIVNADYDPTPATPSDLVEAYDLIVIGRVVEVLPAQWTTPHGGRPDNPYQYTIITPAILQIEGQPLVDRMDADLASEQIVVATEGGEVGRDSIRYEPPLTEGARMLIGVSPIIDGRTGDERAVMTPAGRAWRAGRRYVLTADGKAIADLPRWGSQPADELIEGIRAAASALGTPSP